MTDFKNYDIELRLTNPQESTPATFRSSLSRIKTPAAGRRSVRGGP